MKYVRYNSIKLGRWPVGFMVDYHPEQHLTNYLYNFPVGDTQLLTFSVGMAESVINELTKMLEHSKTDYYKWSKKRTAQ